MSTFVVRVESSAIRVVRYDGSTLTVELHSGHTYDTNEGSNADLF
jgi:hypothetical protein